MSASVVPYMYLLCEAMLPITHGEYYAKEGPYNGYRIYWENSVVLWANGVYGGYGKSIIGLSDEMSYTYFDTTAIYGRGAEVYEDFFY